MEVVQLEKDEKNTVDVEKISSQPIENIDVKVKR